MAIDVVCPGCHKRFSVSDKFAGQKGPCPRCKAVITIPAKEDEVVVHAPETFGPKGIKGEAVLKPIARTETKVSPAMWAAIGGGVLAVLATAVVLRFAFGGAVPTAILALGSLALAPPLVWAGYSFLRDDELEPYRGHALAIRVGICSLVYAILWGVYAWLPPLLYIDEREIFHLFFLVPPIVVAGAFAAFVALDLEFGSGAIHYTMYLLVTLALCFIMGVPVLG